VKRPDQFKAAPTRLPQAEAKSVRCRPEQEHILRRLGEALVVQWDALPDGMQDLLIDQAALVEGREDAPHATADIERFIRTVRVAALSKPAQAEREAQ